MRFISLMMCLLFLFVAFDVSARRKKPNCLRGIVVFEDPERENSHIRATGFVSEYDGKFVVVTNLSVVFRCAHPVIKTIDGKELEYTEILISQDKRNVLLFVLSPDIDSELFKPLEFQEDLSEEIDIKSPVKTYGCKSNHTTITSSKGKVTAIGPKSIEILSKIPYNTNGGPVLSKDSGKVLGVLTILSMDKKKREHEVCRVDTVDKFVTFDPKILEKEIKSIKKAERIPIVAKRLIDSFKLNLWEMTAKVKRERGTTNINSIKKKYVSLKAAIGRLSSKINKFNRFEFMFLNRRLEAAQDKTKNILKRMDDLEGAYENLYEQLKNSRKEDSLKIKKKLKDYSL